MAQFWNSLEAVSALSTVLEVTLLVLGVILFTFERRESTLQERSDERKEKRFQRVERVARAFQWERKARKLSETQKQTLLAKLSDGPKGSIHVNYLGGDSEAADYAAEFKTVFETAGFLVEQHTGFISFSRGTELQMEIGCADSPPDHALAIEKAFQVAGFRIQMNIIKAHTNSWVSVNIGAKQRRVTSQWKKAVGGLAGARFKNQTVFGVDGSLGAAGSCVHR